MPYVARTFSIPDLKGLSQKQLDVHLGLYQGYVKHVNVLTDTIATLRAADPEANAFVINEMRRRLGFEFDGMRMHEYYFEQLEGGSQDASSDSALATLATEKYGSWDAYVAHLKEVAGTRGIGWVVTYYDKVANELHTAFVGDHEVGQLAGLPIILAIDLWEHAFMVDYVPAEKKKYVEAFLENVNWASVEARLQEAQ